MAMVRFSPYLEIDGAESAETDTKIDRERLLTLGRNPRLAGSRPKRGIRRDDLAG